MDSILALFIFSAGDMILFFNNSFHCCVLSVATAAVHGHLMETSPMLPAQEEEHAVKIKTEATINQDGSARIVNDVEIGAGPLGAPRPAGIAQGRHSIAVTIGSYWS